MVRHILIGVLFLSACQSERIPHSSETRPKNTSEYFSVMTYNVHVFDIAHALTNSGFLKSLLREFLALYVKLSNAERVDFDDAKRGEYIVDDILSLENPPDVIVLNEIWSWELRKRLIQRLKNIYPFYSSHREHRSFLYSQFFDSGLLLLSRYPFVEDSEKFIAFKNLTGPDAYTVKGIGEVTIELTPQKHIGVFFTHTQASYTDNSEGDADTLSNIRQLSQVVRNYQLQHPSGGIIIAGDLNIAGDTSAYVKMLKILDGGSQKLAEYIDVYRIFYPNAILNPGYTFSPEENSLVRVFSHMSFTNERLDYVFYLNNGFFSSVHQVGIEDFSYSDNEFNTSLPLSDHYPLSTILKLSSR